MKKHLPAFYISCLAALVTIAFFASYRSDSPLPKKQSFKNTGAGTLPQVIESVDMQRTYSFAGEPMPANFDVRERLDRELMVNSYWHSSTLLHIKKANRYFPIFKKILSEEGVPEDFIYLAVAESGLANVGSPAGAKGLWQFMKPTATHYGLTVNSEVDERYHTEKATRAFCAYIKKLKARFGNWTSAAAAYNMGETRFNRDTQEQGSTSYYDLNLNSETMRYVFRIVALREILSQPRSYGFYLEKNDLYPPLDNYKQVEVSQSIDRLADFAKEHNTTYRMLKIYNPWLRSSKLTIKEGKKYILHVPK